MFVMLTSVYVRGAYTWVYVWMFVHKSGRDGCRLSLTNQSQMYTVHIRYRIRPAYSTGLHNFYWSYLLTNILFDEYMFKKQWWTNKTFPLVIFVFVDNLPMNFNMTFNKQCNQLDFYFSLLNLYKNIVNEIYFLTTWNIYIYTLTCC